MSPDTPVFVAADWRNVEGRLTAFFSGDTALREVLENELRGGPKAHAVNAATIYGCDPEDAKDVKVNLQGMEKDAYDAGKRLTHAWNYGMALDKMMETFWISRVEAVRIDELLASKYPRLVEWRKELVDSVCGRARYECPSCKSVGTSPEPCPAHKWRPRREFKRWDIEPTYCLQTPFGRRRWFYGRRGEVANAIVAQLPQSSGASMWNYTLLRLHGSDTLEDGLWPVPDCEVLTWGPGGVYSRLLTNAPTQVKTGTYDSYVLRTRAKHVDRVVPWLLWTMEQPWAQLGGWRFPSEPAVGLNWGKFDAKKNPGGLKEQPYQAFTASLRGTVAAV